VFPSHQFRLLPKYYDHTSCGASNIPILPQELFSTKFLPLTLLGEENHRLSALGRSSVS